MEAFQGVEVLRQDAPVDGVCQPPESIELEFRCPARFRDGVSTALGEDGGEVHGRGSDSDPSSHRQGGKGAREEAALTGITPFKVE